MLKGNKGEIPVFNVDFVWRCLSDEHYLGYRPGWGLSVGE